MTEPLILVAMASAALCGIAIVTAATLKGWQGWLELKRLELSGRPVGPARGPMSERIELADLKERIRKLESIAAGVDL